MSQNDGVFFVSASKLNFISEVFGVLRNNLVVPKFIGRVTLIRFAPHKILGIHSYNSRTNHTMLI